MPWWRSAVPEAAGLDGDEVFRKAELVTRGRYPTPAGRRRHRLGILPRLPSREAGRIPAWRPSRQRRGAAGQRGAIPRIAGCPYRAFRCPCR